jgi:hypothetical protein
MFKPFGFQPGWATPIIVRHEPSFFATFFRLSGERDRCKARRQGKCPGLDHCHDCTWSRQRASD